MHDGRTPSSALPLNTRFVSTRPLVIPLEAVPIKLIFKGTVWLLHQQHLELSSLPG